MTGHFKSSTRKDFFTHALKMGMTVQIYTIVLSLPIYLVKMKIDMGIRSNVLQQIRKK